MGAERSRASERTEKCKGQLPCRLHTAFASNLFRPDCPVFIPSSSTCTETAPRVVTRREYSHESSFRARRVPTGISPVRCRGNPGARLTGRGSRADVDALLNVREQVLDRRRGKPGFSPSLSLWPSTLARARAASPEIFSLSTSADTRSPLARHHTPAMTMLC